MTETASTSPAFSPACPRKPGVYRMLDADGKVLYVGKARQLRNRVQSYFHGRAHTSKTLVMLGLMSRIEVTVTASATEALLLEANLIKRHRPRYNVQLRDDKSFPYIQLATAHEYPRISFYRGPRSGPNRYFGPYPSSVATRETLLLLQKLFRVRQCEDTFFANRSRPCLQYQIGRCRAPCVRLVSPEDYAQDVADTIRRARRSQHRGDRRPRPAHGSRVAGPQVRGRGASARPDLDAQADPGRPDGHAGQRQQDIDAVAIAGHGGEYCVSVVFVRGGRNLGSSNYFPKGGLGGEEEALAAFLAQYYLARGAPAEILVNLPLEDCDVLESALRERSGHAGSHPPEHPRNARALARDGAHQRGTRA